MDYFYHNEFEARSNQVKYRQFSWPSHEFHMILVLISAYLFDVARWVRFSFSASTRMKDYSALSANTDKPHTWAQAQGPCDGNNKKAIISYLKAIYPKASHTCVPTLALTHPVRGKWRLHRDSAFSDTTLQQALTALEADGKHKTPNFDDPKPAHFPEGHIEP